MSSPALYNYMNESLPVVILERIVGKKDKENVDTEEQNPDYSSGLQETTEDDNSVCEQLNLQTQNRSMRKNEKKTRFNNDETDGVTGCINGHRGISCCNDVPNYETNMNTIKAWWRNGLKEHARTYSP